jgi:hypothetical protein
MTLPWDERIATISINPDMATREDIAMLAAELMEARAEVKRLREALEDMVDQFAYPLDEPPRITTGGLSWNTPLTFWAIQTQRKCLEESVRLKDAKKPLPVERRPRMVTRGFA